MKKGTSRYLEEISTPESFGLLESVGQGRTDIDGDADAEYWELCRDAYSIEEHRDSYCPRESNRLDAPGGPQSGDAGGI